MIEKRESHVSYLNFHPDGGWLCAVSETRRAYLGFAASVNEIRNIGPDLAGSSFVYAFAPMVVGCVLLVRLAEHLLDICE